MSSPILFYMPPLLILQTPDVTSAQNAASCLLLPAVLQAIGIKQWPRGQDVREMMRMLIQNSRADSLPTVKMVWVHRKMMTTPAAITHSPGDTTSIYSSQKSKTWRHLLWWSGELRQRENKRNPWSISDTSIQCTTKTTAGGPTEQKIEWRKTQQVSLNN